MAMSDLREVVYERSDGARVRTMAHWDFRSYPSRGWLVGDTPLGELKVLAAAGPGVGIIDVDRLMGRRSIEQLAREAWEAGL